MKKKIWYLCDGEKPDCKKTHCYKNTDDDPCRYTSDINHAVNFTKKVKGEKTIYRENIRPGGNRADETGVTE